MLRVDVASLDGVLASIISPCPLISGPCTCKIPSKNEKSPLPASLLTVQLLMPNRNYFIATATLVTITFSSHNSALSCFALNETFGMLQQQETLYCG